MGFYSQPAVIATSAQVSAGSIEESDLADDAVSLAKLKAGTDGELITWDASGNPAAVAAGTSGQVLKSNGAGAAPTFQDIAKDWEQLGETVLGSNASTISVAGFAARKDLRVVFHVVGLDGAGNNIVRFNADSGAKYGYNFYPLGGTARGADGGTGIQLPGDAGTQTAPCYCVMHIDNHAAGLRKMYSWEYAELSSTAANKPAISGIGQGVFNDTAAQITTVALIASANNFLAGSRITVYGKKD